MKKANTILALITFLLAAFVLLTVGCTAERRAQVNKTFVDSTAIEELNRKLSVVILERNHYKAELDRMQNSTITFDSTKCPPPVLHISENCNTDSVKAVLEQYFQNQVKIYANGLIEAKGNLRSVNVSLLEQTRIAAQATRQVDSLKEELKTAKSSKQVEIKEKQVQVKIEVLPWWVWLLLPAGGAGWQVLVRIWKKFKETKPV